MAATATDRAVELNMVHNHLIERHRYPPEAVAGLTLEQLSHLHHLVHVAITAVVDPGSVRLHASQEDGWVDVTVGRRHPWFIAKVHVEDTTTIKGTATVGDTYEPCDCGGHAHP